MLHCFPISAPDELLYSLIARYARRIRAFSMEAFSRHLFGSNRAYASIHCPTHLDHLARQLDGQGYLTTDRLIEQHTLFPAYQPFLEQNQAQRLRETMKGQGPSSHGHKLLGQRRASVALPEFLRYCPACAQDEYHLGGDCIWHRLHQLPGIEVCPVHEVWLERSTVPLSNLGPWHKFVTATEAIRNDTPRPIRVYEPGREALLQLARDAAWLLGQRALPSDPFQIWKRYRFVLREQGLCSYRGKIQIRPLLDRFYRVFPVDLFYRLDGKSKRLVSGRGIQSLVRKPRGGLPPLYHLLMIQLLGKTAEEFFHMPPEPEAFSIGPWPCLNPVAPHYQTLVVTKCSVDVQKNGARPVATFSCDCGFQYVRVGSDWGPLAQYSYTRVARYGALWDGKFKRLWSTAEHTLQFISQEVGIAEKNLSLHAARLKLPVWRREHGRATIPGRKRTWRGRSEQPTESVIASARKNWTTLCSMGNPSVSEVGEERRLYHWLFRHDHAWLITQPHRPRVPSQSGSQARVDWKERDAFLSRIIEKMATPLIQNQPLRRHISVNALIRQSGYRHLIQPNLNRLPVTRATLKSIVISHMPVD